MSAKIMFRKYTLELKKMVNIPGLQWDFIVYIVKFYVRERIVSSINI
jgi:hypothetical protein